MGASEQVVAGSGNVYADMGMPDAGIELIKSELAYQLFKRIKALKLTRVQVADKLELPPPEVSKLMKYRPVDFSTDHLVVLLNRLDLDVGVIVRPKSVVPKQSSILEPAE